MSQNDEQQIAHGRAMLARAEGAGRLYREFDRARVSAIVNEVAEVAFRNAAVLAEAAVRETGFGVVEDKLAKNETHSRGFVQRYGHLDFCSQRIDPTERIIMSPRPAGVIFALTPSTGPVATTYFKTLSALLTRSAVVISPHPAAVECTVRAAKLLAEAAERAGAPADLVQVVEKPTIPVIEALMVDEHVKLILATGGSGVVRAAYRSGTPAIGVGPGNPPVIVDETADLAHAADCLIKAKTFDNATLCTAESVLFVVDSVASKLIKELQQRGGYLCSAADVARLRAYMYPDNGFNAAVVGKYARDIAAAAGIEVPGNTRVLLAPFDSVVPEEGLTHEKLSPVLGVRVVKSFRQGVGEARSLLRIVGAGHSAVIHSNDRQNVLDWSAAMNVQRITVNLPGALGNTGWGTNLPATMSAGTGFEGGCSTGDNLSPEHLVHWNRTAYGAGSDTLFPDFGGLVPALPSSFDSPGNAQDSTITLPSDLREELRRIVVEELRAMIGAS